MCQADPWHSRASAACDRRSDRCGSTARGLELPRRTCAPTHPYFSSWYTWPWLYRPTWYYFNQTTEAAVTVRGIVALGNPALWWVSVPVTAVGARHAACAPATRGGSSAGSASRASTCRGGSRPARSTTATTCSRPSPTPASAWASCSTATGTRRAATLARGYLALVVVTFLFFYPFLAALPVPVVLVLLQHHAACARGRGSRPGSERV